MSQQRLVEVFMRAHEQGIPDSPTLEGYPTELRIKLIMEEAIEFAAACGYRIQTINHNTDEEKLLLINEGREPDIVEMMDALADLLYVTHGAASAAGVDLEPIFSEVHSTNMKKLGPDGRPIRREDGKVLKPADWKPPRIKQLIDFQKKQV